jgi:hypothetical protein
MQKTPHCRNSYKIQSKNHEKEATSIPLTHKYMTSSAEDRSDQTKDYEIGICCFSAKHEGFRRKSNDWLDRNHNNVSEWSDMSIRGLLFQ